MSRISFSSPFVALAAALIVTLLFLHDVVFGGRSLLASDYTSVLRDETVNDKPTALWRIGNSRSILYRQHDLGASAWQFEPAVHFMTRVIWQGETPYWNPYVATGALGPEILADMKFSAAAVATALLGGSSLAYHFVLCVAVFLASYCLIRLATVFFAMTPLGVVATLAAFLLGGYTQTHLVNALFIFIYLAIPIVLYTLLALARAQSSGRLLLAVAANVVLFSFSFTPILILAAVFAQGLCLLFIFTEIEPGRRLRAVALANVAVPLLTLLLLAPLYLPAVASFADTMILQRYLTRGRLLSFPLSDLPQLFMPAGYKMSIVRGGAALPTFGAIAGLLACIGALSNGPHRAVRWGLAAASLLGLAVAFRIWPAIALMQIPVFRTIKPAFWGFLFSVPIPLLVGFGVSALQRRERLTPLIALAALGIAAAFFLDFVFYAHKAPPWAHWNFAIAAALFVIALIALAAIRLDAQHAKFATYAVVALLIADGLFSTNLLRPPRLDKGADPPEILAWMRDTLGGPHQARVLNIGRRSLYPDWADALGVAQVGTINISELRWFYRFYTTHIGNEWRLLSLGRHSDYVPLFTDATLDLLGVRFVVVDRGQVGSLTRMAELGYPVVREDGVRQIYENPGYLERAIVVGALVKSKDIPGKGRVGLDVAATTDGRLLEAARALGISNQPAGRAGTANITEYRHGKVALKAELDRPGILVVSDAWHPSWRAQVDGKDAHIALVNGAFRGIALPAGSHDIVMTYTPHYFDESLILAALGAFGVIGLTAGLWWRRRGQAAP
jgi:hypothetical protein